MCPILGILQCLPNGLKPAKIVNSVGVKISKRFNKYEFQDYNRLS